MCSILKEVHHYLPTEKVTLNLTLPTGESRPLDSELFYRIMLGGYQLAVACAHSGCSTRIDHDPSANRSTWIIASDGGLACKNVLLKSMQVYYVLIYIR